MNRRTVTIHHVVGTARWCHTCHSTSAFPIYAYIADDPTTARQIATYCPTCSKDTP